MADDRGVMLWETNPACYCVPPNLTWTLREYKEDPLPGEGERLPQKMTVIEESSCFQRCCCHPASHSLIYRAYNGVVDPKSEPASRPPVVLQWEKGCTFHRAHCCCTPELVTKDGSGNVLGRTFAQWQCLPCKWIPVYGVERGGALEYTLSPDTCCCGLCINIDFSKCKGSRCGAVPFYLRDATGNHVGDSHVTELWAGLRPLCSCRIPHFYQ
jgi:hypothetical protein